MISLLDLTFEEVGVVNHDSVLIVYCTVYLQGIFIILHKKGKKVKHQTFKFSPPTTIFPHFFHASLHYKFMRLNLFKASPVLFFEFYDFFFPDTYLKSQEFSRTRMSFRTFPGLVGTLGSRDTVLRGKINNHINK